MTFVVVLITTPQKKRPNFGRFFITFSFPSGKLLLFSYVVLLGFVLNTELVKTNDSLKWRSEYKVYKMYPNISRKTTQN